MLQIAYFIAIGKIKQLKLRLGRISNNNKLLHTTTTTFDFEIECGGNFFLPTTYLDFTHLYSITFDTYSI